MVMDELNNWPKKTGFAVPENYFQEMENEVMNKINGAEIKKSKFSILKPYLAIAASFIAVFFVWQAIIFSGLAHRLNKTENNYSYLDLQLDDMDETTIVSAFTDDENKLKNDDVIDYLSGTDIDISILENN